MRALTPDVDRVLGLFARCYTRQAVPMSAPRYERTAWPQGSALDDNEAWLLSALEWVRVVMNGVAIDEWNAAVRKATKRRPVEASPAEAPSYA